MIGTGNTNNFLAETDTEESLMLMGKVNALRGIWEVMPDEINAKIVNAIFGFEPQESEEVKTLREDLSLYKKWYFQELNRANGLLEEKVELENKLANKEVSDGNTL